MAALVDTCGWIEWLTDGQLADAFAPYLADPAELIVPTTLQFELYKWAKRERSEVEALDVIALTEQGRILPLTTRLALYAADLALQHQLSFADAIIYTSARMVDLPLITADDHFKDLPEVIYFSKKRPTQQ
ncbi:MAG: PIN domain-containing protein [Methylobacter sp.]